MTTKPTRLVHRIEDGQDRQEVIATTYQMRNFYRQMGDGFFSGLDVMNYIQHHQIARMVKPGMEVVDLCCGRGLMLPLLRYQKKNIAGYTGVDIAPGNATFQEKRVTDGKPLDPDYYPFPVRFIEANVAEVDRYLPPKHADMVIYTSSIEHMHPAFGEQSLQGARSIVKPNGTMVLTCPRTPEDQDGYNTQYRAHVYEWKMSELHASLKKTGWRVVHEYGLYMSATDLMEAAQQQGLGAMVTTLKQVIPAEWLVPVLAPLFTDVAKEVALVCKPVKPEVNPSDTATEQ